MIGPMVDAAAYRLVKVHRPDWPPGDDPFLPIVDGSVPMHDPVAEADTLPVLRSAGRGCWVVPFQARERLADDLELPLDRRAREGIPLVVDEG